MRHNLNMRTVLVLAAGRFVPPCPVHVLSIKGRRAGLEVSFID
jgi:hypothetical protein